MSDINQGTNSNNSVGIKNRPIKVLNLYACLGGNRYKWDEVADINVTAVEIDPELARLYSERFPNDKVYVCDAHKFLLDNINDYDFIWSSPPCISHSRVRYSQINNKSFKPCYPDLKLYEEIIFLYHHFKGYFVVENVNSYYPPLIKAVRRGRHLFWSNFYIPEYVTYNSRGRGLISSSKKELTKLCQFHNYDFYKYNGTQRRISIARSLVDYNLGKNIFQIAANIILYKKPYQCTIFD